MRFAIGWGIPLVLSERFISSVKKSLVVVIIESLNLKASTDKGGRDFLVWFGCNWRHMNRGPLTGFVRVKYVHNHCTLYCCIFDTQLILMLTVEWKELCDIYVIQGVKFIRVYLYC